MANRQARDENEVVAWAASGRAANAPTIQAVDLTGGDPLEYYSIRNGALGTVKPYLQKATVSPEHKWVTIPGIRPREALKSMDAFIKVHWWHLERTAPTALSDEAKRKAAFLLGASRCVMMANYGLTSSDFIAGELEEGPLEAEYDAGRNVSYKLIGTKDKAPTVDAGESSEGEAAPATQTAAPVVDKGRERLTDDFELSAPEKAVLTSVVRSAQVMIPIQGHNLLDNNHHYISTGNTAGFRAFCAVENQVWVGEAAKNYLDGDKDNVRTLMWHRAAHPVLPQLKKKLATSRVVAQHVADAGIGSAAARLPAIESELKPIQTYAKLTEAVKLSILMYGGRLENRVFREVEEALYTFPMGEESVIGPDGNAVSITLGPYSEGGQATVVRNRQEISEFAISLINKSQESIGMCYGYFTKMTEEQNMMGGGTGSDTLKRAYSLRKLRDACPASFGMGYEMAADYKAFRASLRAAGDWSPPDIGFGG